MRLFVCLNRKSLHVYLIAVIIMSRCMRLIILSCELFLLFSLLNNSRRLPKCSYLWIFITSFLLLMASTYVDSCHDPPQFSPMSPSIVPWMDCQLSREREIEREMERGALWYQTNTLFAYFVREMQSQQTCLSKTMGGSSFQQERAKVGCILFTLWSWQRAVYVLNHLDNMIRVIKSKSFESADVRVSHAEFRRSGLSASLSCCLYVCNCLLMCVLFSLTSSCLSSSGAPIRKLPWQLAALQLSCCDGCTGGGKRPEGQNWWEGWEIEVTVHL